MRQYAKDHNFMTRLRRKLVGSFHGDKILHGTPLLRWYLGHILEVTRVYQVIECDQKPCIRRFGDSVSSARPERDAYRTKSPSLTR